jgi:two-component sensor histidine kinase/PAS domain-containing protein
LSRKLRTGAPAGLAYAFLTTAVLRFFGSAIDSENEIIWLHRLCSLSLGVALLLEGRPVSNSQSKRRPLALALVVSLALVLAGGIITAAYPYLLPASTVGHRVTPFLRAVSFSAGSVYILAALLRWREVAVGSKGSLPLFICCVFLAVPALLYSSFSVWSMQWWLFQVIELCVSLYLATWFFLAHGRELIRMKDDTLREQARLLDLSSNAIIIRDEAGHIKYWNSGAAALYGWGATEASAEAESSLLKTVFPASPSEIERDLECTGRWAGELRQSTRSGRALVVASRWVLDKTGRVGRRIMEINTDISEVKEGERQLRASLKEKEVLLREIHHRVKNNLQVVSSLLYLQARRVDQEPLRNLLLEGRNRIQSIALIHEKLYRAQDLASIDFGLYLKDLTGQVAKALGVQAPRATVEVQADNVVLDIDHAIPCGLIVNELASNSMKHGFPDGRAGSIHIFASQVEPGWLELVVSDTGVGFPANVDVNSTATLGMELVRSLVKQLRGTVNLSCNGGTRVEIRFPFEAPRGFSASKEAPSPH